MKIDISEVESTLLEKHFEPNKVQEIIRDLEKIVEELKNDKDQTPKSKYEYAVILLDKEGILKDKEFGAWVVQQEENEDSGLIISKLQDAAKNQNEAAKRKKNVMKNLTDLFESLKPKFLKEKKLKIKTKELVRCIVTKGEF